MSATSPTAVPSFRGRIGRDARSGHYPVPHRYRLHLALSCPHCLGIAVTHSLLGLGATLPVTLLPAVPDAPGGGHRALRPLYEASAHQHGGPALAPVLGDDWTGRIVSVHPSDILHDLTRHFGGVDGGDAALCPPGAEEAAEEYGRLCAQGIAASAQRAGQPGVGAAVRERALGVLFDGLAKLERRLASRRHVLGDRMTVADVHVWVALVQLDTVHRWHLDASAVHRLAGHPHLWAYARRLAARPAFGAHLDLDGIARRHHAHCRGTEAAGAAVQIVDWAACLPCSPCPPSLPYGAVASERQEPTA